jgi:serine protease Do
MGGAFVAAFFQFVVPTVQPSTKSFFSSIIPNDNLVNSGDKKDAAGVAQKLDTNQDADAPVTDIAEKVSPSIVGISVTNTSRSQGYFFFQQQQAQPSEGSGIIIKSDGYIMTNFHVIENALNSSGKVSSNAKIQVILPNQKDKPYTAQLVGGDKKTDLAVLKIDGTNLPAVTLGNSDNIKVGELAVAIGNPAGLEYMGQLQ